LGIALRTPASAWHPDRRPRLVRLRLHHRRGCPHALGAPVEPAAVSN